MNFVQMLELSQESRISAAPRVSLPTLQHAMRGNILKTVDVYSDKTCADFEADGYNTEFGHAAGIVCFAVLSMIVTGSVALMMSNNKQLMSHPNKLIFYMCICEGIVAW